MSKDRKTENFCIIGEEGPLSEITHKDHTLVLHEGVYGSGHFYTDALMANSIGAIKTMDKIIERDITDKYRASLFKGVHHLG